MGENSEGGLDLLITIELSYSKAGKRRSIILLSLGDAEPFGPPLLL